MRKIIALAMVLALMLTFAACGKSIEKDELSGKKFIYEKEGYGGDFTITLNEDGTFKYYEGRQSSHIGKGKWTLEKNLLTLQENTKDHQAVYCFQASAEGLSYLQEGSDAFLFVKVADGEQFQVTVPQEETYSANLETFWDNQTEAN